MEHSVACLEAKANVCCVKFNPESRYHLSFGSAGMNLKQVEKAELSQAYFKTEIFDIFGRVAFVFG